jgi:hypothetical protein
VFLLGARFYELIKVSICETTTRLFQSSTNVNVLQFAVCNELPQLLNRNAEPRGSLIGCH